MLIRDCSEASWTFDDGNAGSSNPLFEVGIVDTFCEASAEDIWFYNWEIHTKSNDYNVKYLYAPADGVHPLALK